MSLLKFGFTKRRLDNNGLVIPDSIPNVPRRAVVLANQHVAQVNNANNKRGDYDKSLKPEDRFKIGKFASTNGVKAAGKKFAKAPSSIRTWKKQYESALNKLGMITFLLSEVEKTCIFGSYRKRSKIW